MKLITTSPNIAALDSMVVFDLCAGKIYVDVIPTSYIGAGILNVLGASVKITNPYGVVVKDYPTSGYDIEGGSPPMEEIVEINIPTLASNYQYGTYTVVVKMVDADGTEYEESKSVNICEPDSANKQRNYGSLSAKLKGVCKEGKLYVIADTPPNYRGAIVESQENVFVLEYPTSSGLDPLETVITAFSAPLFEGVYKFTGTVCATYNLGNNIYVNVNYKMKAKKEMFCIIDECCIFTKLTELHTQLGTDCTEEERSATASIVIDVLRLLKTIELSADCGDDPSDYVKELETLLGCKCTCGCNEGTPIINNSPSSNVLIEGCNVTKQTVGLTDVYTIENYEYAVTVDPNGGMLYVASNTLANCTKTARIVFDITKVYTGIKQLADANADEATFWANVINKNLIGVDPDCLGISQGAWDALTFKQKVEKVVEKLCACCGCDGAIANISESRDGADYIIEFDITDAHTADVFLDGVLQATILNQGNTVTVRLTGAADGELHAYTIIPRCSNGHIGMPATGDFQYIACPTIEPPSVSSNNVNGVECPYDLTSLVSPLASGLVEEWHTANNTQASTLLGDPTSVSSGVYYVFAKDESTGCYSIGVKVTLVCESASACTAPQNLQVSNIVGGFLVQFQSAAFPPPLNSYTVKRRLASDPDVDGSYTTIGTPTWNAGSARWEILDATAVVNTLYVYKAQSNCGDDTTPSVQYQFAEITCKAITLTPHVDSMDYSFVPFIGTGIDKYEISIYDASGSTLIHTDTHVPAFANPTEGTFNYLDPLTTYRVRARVYIGDYYKDCTWYLGTTEEAAGEDNFEVENNAEGGVIMGVTPAFYLISSGAFPINFLDAAQGIHGGGTHAVAVSIDASGASEGSVTLFKNGVPLECIAVPAGAATATYTFASQSFLTSDLVEVIYNLGAC